MKIIFLIAPSEGKNLGGNFNKENLTFTYEKPTTISQNASEKDLKCIGERYKQGINLNKTIEDGPFDRAINRYSGIVFNSISYNSMSNTGKAFFEENTVILSGMYGILNPLDIVGNYKLPIETKGLYKFWRDQVANNIAFLNPDYVVNLLPNSYSKLVGIGKCSKLKKIRDLYLGNGKKIININFYKDSKRLTHAVKKYRGEFLRKVCENNLTDFKQFGGKIVENLDFVDVDIEVK